MSQTLAHTGTKLTSMNYKEAKGFPSREYKHLKEVDDKLFWCYLYSATKWIGKRVFSVVYMKVQVPHEPF